MSTEMAIAILILIFVLGAAVGGILTLIYIEGKLRRERRRKTDRIRNMKSR